MKFYTEAEKEAFEERAAIMEYGANYSRPAAEFYARKRTEELRRRPREK